MNSLSARHGAKSGRAKKWGVLGGGQKVYVEKVYVLFRSLSAPKSQRFLRFAIAMPIADPRNRAISETRESNAALRFKSAMESR